MNVIHKFLPILFLFFFACGQNADKKPNKLDRKNKGADQQRDGPSLFSRYGCFACHSLDGSEMYGPTLKGLYMKEVEVVRQGQTTTVVADRNYLKKAIMDPDYEKVANHRNNVMPKPVIPEEDADALVDYLIEMGKDNP